MRLFFRYAVIFSVIISFSVVLFSSCNKASQAQLQQLDSLDAILDAGKKSLNLDTQVIMERSSSMEDAMAKIQRYYKGSYTEDLARDMDVYRGTQKIYARFLDAYPLIVAETEHLLRQARNLRYSAKKGELTELEFTNHYAKEYQDAQRNAENIRTYVYPVYDAEPHFKRIQVRVDSMLKLSVPTE